MNQWLYIIQFYQYNIFTVQFIRIFMCKILLSELLRKPLRKFENNEHILLIPVTSNLYENISNNIFMCLCFFLNSCRKTVPAEKFHCNEDGYGDTGKLNIIFILADDVGYELPAYTGGSRTAHLI